MIYSINMHTTVYQFWRFVYHHEQSVIDHYVRSSLYTRSFCTGSKLYVGHFLWPQIALPIYLWICINNPLNPILFDLVAQKTILSWNFIIILCSIFFNKDLMRSLRLILARSKSKKFVRRTRFDFIFCTLHISLKHNMVKYICKINATCGVTESRREYFDNNWI